MSTPGYPIIDADGYGQDTGTTGELRRDPVPDGAGLGALGLPSDQLPRVTRDVAEHLNSDRCSEMIALEKTMVLFVVSRIGGGRLVYGSDGATFDRTCADSTITGRADLGLDCQHGRPGERGVRL